ncbi:MAG: hypothetical protein IKJ36_03930 [Clostridia bacterium]|nr:hypothetical protein [Clostridia bacterium]
MGLMSFLLDVYENTRKTKTNVKPDKNGRSKNYDFDAGITGDRKLDCPKVETPRIKKSNSSKRAKCGREDR